MPTELIAIIANIALTLSVVVAVIFGIIQTRTAHKDRRIKLTIETLNHFQTREFAENMLYVYRHEFPANYEEWVQHHEEQVRYVHIAQQLESLGLLVAERMISLDLLDKTLGSYITVAWEKFRPLTMANRERNNDPYMNEYFQWLAEQIDRRMNNDPRQPFFMTNQQAVK